MRGIVFNEKFITGGNVFKLYLVIKSLLNTEETKKY